MFVSISITLLTELYKADSIVPKGRNIYSFKNKKEKNSSIGAAQK
jgi:hypothetical protein